METKKGRPRRRWLRTVIILGVVILLYVIAGALLKSMLVKKVEVTPGTVLEIDIGQAVSEGPADGALLGALTGDGAVSIWDVRSALSAAAKDPNIVGVRLLLQAADIGWAAAEELLAAVDDFRTSAKPVYVLYQSDLLGDREYFLSTAGDQIWVSPETAVLINGLSLEVAFWRGTLEKLRIEPEIIMFKEYKSAGEPYQNREMSSYMREAYTGILDTIDARFKERVAASRNLSTEAITDLIGLGVATTDELKRRGFVDRLGYLDEVEQAFEKLSAVDEYKGVSHADYLLSLEKDTAVDKPAIAVLFGEGAILAQDPGGMFSEMGPYIYGPVLAAHIREAVDDPSIAALVIRVNSPGGSAVGSDVIMREIDRARGAGKPVIISMSDVAGSGGYWISMHADSIVARPTTITGSIGVVFTKFNLTGFMDWFGVSMDSVETAPYANLLSFANPLDLDRRERFTVWMDDIYNSFVGKVANGRQMTPEEVEQIARGRIWSGRDALEKGLVDGLGGMAEAIALAKERADLDAATDYPIVVLPKPKPLIEQILDGSLFAGVPQMPSKTEILTFATSMARPQVLVKMHEAKIH
ncbi:MAG: signal peptide peptidase SppA [Myxococcota bacterium]|nr:signal peptide peptidase SppA [Myxococcota bacterium]